MKSNFGQISGGPIKNRLIGQIGPISWTQIDKHIFTIVRAPTTPLKQSLLVNPIITDGDAFLNIVQTSM